MKTFKDKAINYFTYSLLVIPTLLFLIVLTIGNILLESDIKKVKENKPLIKESSLIVDLPVFISEKDKIKWCDKRIECTVLAEVGYHEARGENDQGVVSVMHVTMNRAKSDHPIFRNQKTIKQVAYAKSQYSYVWDGSKARGMKSKQQSNRVKVLAYDVMNKLVDDTTDSSLYYHTNSVNPDWSRVYAYTYTIGNHRFYKHN